MRRLELVELLLWFGQKATEIAKHSRCGVEATLRHIVEEREELIELLVRDWVDLCVWHRAQPIARDPHEHVSREGQQLSRHGAHVAAPVDQKVENLSMPARVAIRPIAIRMACAESGASATTTAATSQS